MFAHTFKQHTVMAAATLLAAFALTACSPAAAQPSTPPAAAVEAAVVTPTVVQIVTKDHLFEAPAEIEGGWVTVKSRNEGAEPHHVQLAQLNDGVTFEAFVEALQQGPEVAFPLMSLAGGPGPLDTGGEAVVTVELAPGNYVLADFLPSADGVPHIAKGMLAPLTVVAPANGADDVTVALPEVAGEVKLMSFSFVLPQEIQAGEQVWKVTNEGDQWHEISLIKLAEGKTMMDVTHWMHAPDGPPPFTNVGGMQGLDPGESAYLHLDLTPGEYVGLCHIPDPASGKEHAELGMVMPFTVK
ncbi:MAG: hypothetical protein DCC55_10885 [Chloroflexi bacterium]|nr:MAG: hypothetical protein DCC55_10885 [Chloroflexota bacterium]